VPWTDSSPEGLAVLACLNDASCRCKARCLGELVLPAESGVAYGVLEPSMPQLLTLGTLTAGGGGHPWCRRSPPCSASVRGSHDDWRLGTQPVGKAERTHGVGGTVVTQSHRSRIMRTGSFCSATSMTLHEGGVDGGKGLTSPQASSEGQVACCSAISAETSHRTYPGVCYLPGLGLLGLG
jgi:hypothetical protein